MKPLLICMLIGITALCLVLAGCGLMIAFLAPAAGNPPVVNASRTDATAVPQLVEEQSLGAPKVVSFKNIRFQYNPALAKEVKPYAVPGWTEPWVPFDSFQFEFEGYAIQSPAQPHLWVFATNLVSADDNRRKGITALARSLSARTDPGKNLPVYLTGPSANELDLPVFVPLNARPVLSTQWSTVQGAGVNGLRFVTVYAQGPNPLDPNTLVYAYSGLNADRTAGVAAAFPVRPAVPLTLPKVEMKTLLDDLSKMDAYNRQVAEQIARLGPADFSPDLRLIDQVMASLTLSGPLPVITEKSAN